MHNIENCQFFLNELGISASDQERIETYLSLLWEANRDMNLFSRKMTEADLLHLHLLDSLLGLVHVSAKIKSVVDLGTGGGFPAIPLAICLPDIEFTLVEKSTKKASFLDSLKWLVPNIRVVCGQVPAGVEEGTDLVICRAFKSLPVILELTRDYLKSGGKYLLWKARKETIESEIAQSQNLLKKYQGKLKLIQIFHPTRDVERHLIQIN